MRLWSKGNTFILLGTIIYHGNILQVSQITKNRTTIWFRASIPGYISKRNKNFNLRRYMHPPHVQNSIIYNCQDMEATTVSINKWIKIVCVCVCVCVYGARLVARSCLTVTLGTLAHQVPLSMQFSRKEYWSEVQVYSLMSESPGKVTVCIHTHTHTHI